MRSWRSGPGDSSAVHPRGTPRNRWDRRSDPLPCSVLRSSSEEDGPDRWRPGVANFNCAIVTPSEQILDDEVVEVEFPQWDGQRGILTGAAPFVGRLGTGRLRIRYEQGAEKNFLLAGGFAEMHDNRLVLVADEIVPVTEIDAAAAKTRFDAAVAAIAEPGTHSPEARERLEHERQVAAAALSLAGSAG
ncbi:MAG TPA: ATP synthase F1 subunit epsilon [Phycisphaerales bacterium]|nr:ATP synthase F1 subunit epsilon [Phycisphaerales bacterium]